MAHTVTDPEAARALGEPVRAAMLSEPPPCVFRAVRNASNAITIQVDETPGKDRRNWFNKERLRRDSVGFVFQAFNLFPHMTAVGNVMEGLRTVKRIARDAARTRAEKELARVGLADKAETYPAHLSGGQKQRVAIARALAMDPELLLFDEPTSALDPELVGEVLNVIRALADEGRTMLLVTHELGFAYHVATRVIFLADGTIHEQGTPDEILKNPQKERTKAFLARHKEFSL